MTEILCITVPSPPSLNQLYGTTRNGGMFKKKGHSNYVTDVQKMCPRKPFKQNVALELHWFRPSRRGDIDNCLKTLLDALQGFLYEKDSQIVELFVKKDYDKQNPRMEIRCYEIG